MVTTGTASSINCWGWEAKKDRLCDSEEEAARHATEKSECMGIRQSLEMGGEEYIGSGTS